MNGCLTFLTTLPQSCSSLSLSASAGLPHWLSSEESTCNAGDTGDAGLIPGLGRSPRGGHGNSSILAWRIPWIEEPGGLQSIKLKRVGRTQKQLSTHALCLQPLELDLDLPSMLRSIPRSCSLRRHPRL